MTYGLESGLFLEDAAATDARHAASARHFVRGRSWRMLEPERRLQIVEKALNTPSNDFTDGLPVAL